MADNSATSTFVPTTFGKNVFFLKHQGDPIFYREFDAASNVDVLNDIISIESHFFNTGEKLKYTSPVVNSSIQISTSSPGNTLGTSFLPEEVYPIVVDSGKIRLALSRDLALSNDHVNITGLGTGTLHSFECEKKNTKCLITINNIIQSPISVASTVGIVTIVDGKTLELESLEGISIGTILKTGDEYSKVISIRYSDTTVGMGTVIVFRGESVLGTPTTTWDQSLTYVSIVNGNYNIIKDKIYFTESPFSGIKINYDLYPTDFLDSSNSFNLFNTRLKTGALVGIATQNPPQGLDIGRYYYVIKNYDNNFSFANNYNDAVAGTKVEFNMNQGQYDPTSAPGKLVLYFNDFSVVSSSYGRAFLRSDYSGNAVFDDISQGFNGISSSFELKSSGLSTTGISSDNGVVLINNIFQYPEFEESFTYVGIGSTTNIQFIGFGTDGDSPKDYDVNVKGLPRGGIIVGYGLSGGTNYQPLRQGRLYETGKISSGSDYIINSSNIGIAYSGSGYRTSPGYAASVTFEQNGNRISGYGTAIIQDGHIVSINVLSDCVYPQTTSTPNIIVEPPLEYQNIPVSGGSSGIGAKVSFSISDSGNIQSFAFTNNGYGYSIGDVLSISAGIGNTLQTVGDELKIVVLSTGKDLFSAWNFGKLRKLDDLTPYVNGTRKLFNLMENGDLVSIESNPGSPIDVEKTILVFVNDVLQIPNESYTFDGGTQLLLSEAPAFGSTLKVYFYSGSENDTIFVDVIPKLKVGDKVSVKKNIAKNPQTQFNRTVKRILSSDKLKTEIYNKKGLSYDSTIYRPVDMIPQKRDLIIGGEVISKSRELLECTYVGFTSIKTSTGNFSVSYASTIGIDTSGINVGDYIESIFTDSYKVTSISNGVIGISTYATNDNITSTSISIWRKI